MSHSQTGETLEKTVPLNTRDIKKKEEIDKKNARRILGLYPTGVAIVTTCCTLHQRKIGLTINSFASLSLDPFLILWSLVNGSPNLSFFQNSRFFAISMLNVQQKDLAIRFSTPTIANKFEGVATVNTPENIPIIENALAYFICENDQQYEAGDHQLFMGKVIRCDKNEAIPCKPLVFYNGSFTRIEDA